MMDGPANCNQGLGTLSDHLWRFNILQTTGTFFAIVSVKEDCFLFIQYVMRQYEVTPRLYY